VRTWQRLELARTLLGFDVVTVVNVLNVATFRTNGMSTAGAELAPWLDSRDAISEALGQCDGVLLGYGVSEPTGPARLHYRKQLDWLWTELDKASHPQWSVELPPRHPSRWHRLTHKLAPDSSFADILGSVLLPTPTAPLVVSSESVDLR
jgi:hypothetical protein